LAFLAILRQWGLWSNVTVDSLCLLGAALRTRPMRVNPFHPKAFKHTHLETHTIPKAKITSFATKRHLYKCMILNEYLVPRGGIEPPTLRFSVACSGARCFSQFSAY
jgi:hypothetical protein